MTRALYLYCHGWRRPRVSRDGLWPQLVLGFWTVDLLPRQAALRLSEMLGDWRRDFGRITPMRKKGTRNVQAKA